MLFVTYCFLNVVQLIIEKSETTNLISLQWSISKHITKNTALQSLYTIHYMVLLELKQILMFLIYVIDIIKGCRMCNKYVI